MRPMIVFLAASLFCHCLIAQQNSAPASFAVATIKPSAPDTRPLVQIRGNRFATEGTTFLDIFKYAYSIQPEQLAGGPEWLRTAKFDVLADPETNERPNSDQMKKLVQSLLVERFHLVIHIDRRPLQVYLLARSSEAPKLVKSAADPGGIPTAAFEPKGELRVGNATMDDFARFLQRFVLDRPAVNQTNISGHYDLMLRWAPTVEGSIPNPGELVTPADDRPDLFTAIKEQLGLKLAAGKAMADVYVVDRAEKPDSD